MKPWRPDNWSKYSNKQPPSGSPNTESFEAGADAVLEALEPLIRKIAPSSKLVDILYPDEGG